MGTRSGAGGLSNLESDSRLEGNVSSFVPRAVELLAIAKDVPHEIDLYTHAFNNLLSIAIFNILEAKATLELCKVFPEASIKNGSASAKCPSPRKFTLLC